MTRSCRGALAATALLGLWALSASPARTQPAKPDPFKVVTADGVELHGTFYPSAKAQAPVVICLHQIGSGESSSLPNWKALAETLQPNLNVVLFDFRGHGKSKTIQPDVFWKVEANATNVKGFPKKEEIEIGDISKKYYSFLANDIAAVKAYVDRKNDAGACNSASTILIGAEQGATLGAIWVNSEWYRYKMMPVANTFPQQMKPANEPEGKDIIACIWLSPASKLGDSNITLSSTLELPVKQKATASVFMYGDGDKSGKDLAVSLEKKLKEKNKKFDLVTAYEVPKTTLKGAKLIAKGLGTEVAINEFLVKNVVPNRSNEYYERDWRKSHFAWNLAGKLTPVRDPSMDSNNLKFQSYVFFLGR